MCCDSQILKTSAINYFNVVTGRHKTSAINYFNAAIGRHKSSAVNYFNAVIRRHKSSAINYFNAVTGRHMTSGTKRFLSADLILYNFLLEVQLLAKSYVKTKFSKAPFLVGFPFS